LPTDVGARRGGGVRVTKLMKTISSTAKVGCVGVMLDLRRNLRYYIPTPLSIMKDVGGPAGQVSNMPTDVADDSVLTSARNVSNISNIPYMLIRSPWTAM
jgi:hypothetical protein